MPFGPDACVCKMHFLSRCRCRGMALKGLLMVNDLCTLCGSFASNLRLSSCVCTYVVCADTGVRSQGVGFNTVCVPTSGKGGHIDALTRVYHSYA